jgi:hypothetical protein
MHNLCTQMSNVSDLHKRIDLKGILFEQSAMKLNFSFSNICIIALIQLTIATQLCYLGIITSNLEASKHGNRIETFSQLCIVSVNENNQ